MITKNDRIRSLDISLFAAIQSITSDNDNVLEVVENTYI